MDRDSRTSVGLAGFEAAIATTYGPIRMKPDPAEREFPWEVSRWALGPLNVSHVSYSGPVQGRITSPAAQSDRKIVLMAVDKGAVELEQRHRGGRCDPQGLVLMNVGQPLEGVGSGTTALLAATIPTAVLQTQCPEIEERCGVVVPCQTGSASVLHDLLRSVLREKEAIGPIEASVITRMVCSMVSCVFRGGDVEQGRESLLRAYRERIVQVVDDELQNPELCPRLIAERLAISQSYLFALARRSGISLGQLILDRRLDRCREALDDPNWSRRSITDIAFAWGFKELSHFSRRFSERFGQTAVEYRRQAG